MGDSFSRKVLSLATAHAIESASLCLRALAHYIEGQNERENQRELAEEARKADP